MIEMKLNLMFIFFKAIETIIEIQMDSTTTHITNHQLFAIKIVTEWFPLRSRV